MGLRIDEQQERDSGLRRIALQIALQLPAAKMEAEQVMAYVAEVLAWRDPAPYPQASVGSNIIKLGALAACLLFATFGAADGFADVLGHHREQGALVEPVNRHARRGADLQPLVEVGAACGAFIICDRGAADAGHVGKALLALSERFPQELNPPPDRP